MLGRKIWEEDILDVDGDDPPPHVVGAGGEQLADWRAAKLIRRELEMMVRRR